MSGGGRKEMRGLEIHHNKKKKKRTVEGGCTFICKTDKEDAYSQCGKY